jgi:hypothetical protein
MKTNNQSPKNEVISNESNLPTGVLFYEDQYGKRKKCCYDLSPIAELLEQSASPEEFSQILRDIHHNYATLLLEDFMEADAAGSEKEVIFDCNTTNNLFHLKLLADRLDGIDTIARQNS